MRFLLSLAGAGALAIVALTAYLNLSGSDVVVVNGGRTAAELRSIAWPRGPAESLQPCPCRPSRRRRNGGGLGPRSTFGGDRLTRTMACAHVAAAAPRQGPRLDQRLNHSLH